jgi:hypothetical protein
MSSDESAVNRTVLFAYPLTSSNNIVSASVPVAHLNSEILDAAFITDAGAAVYPGGMEAMQRDHQYRDAVRLGEFWSYKYLLDFDGMGYSGRFMSLLASDSAVIKNTVYEEYYSDWIQPWYGLINTIRIELTCYD